MFAAVIKSAKSMEDAARKMKCSSWFVRKYVNVYKIDTSHLPGPNGKLNILGNVYGRLTVISEAPNKRVGDPAWNCLCECGNQKEIDAHHLYNNIIHSKGTHMLDTILGWLGSIMELIETLGD